MIVVSYLVHQNTLLQNKTDLLQNAIAILLKNATKMRQKFIINCPSFLLQIVTVLLKCDDFYTKCDGY